VKLCSLALDYDGTIALDDRIGPGVRDAIAFARSRGVTVLLATGRILDDLRRVAGELQFVDGVVAENGAVLHFPESNHTSLLAPAVPQCFLDDLARRGVAFRSGKSIVDADAADAPGIPRTAASSGWPRAAEMYSSRATPSRASPGSPGSWPSS